MTFQLYCKVIVKSKKQNKKFWQWLCNKVEISSQSFVVSLLTQILSFQDFIVFRDLFFTLYFLPLHVHLRMLIFLRLYFWKEMKSYFYEHFRTRSTRVSQKANGNEKSNKHCPKRWIKVHVFYQPATNKRNLQISAVFICCCDKNWSQILFRAKRRKSMC